MSLPRDPLLFLDDMLMAVEELELFMQRGEEAFHQELVLRRAMERSLEILGEAAAQLPIETKDSFPQIPGVV